MTHALPPLWAEGTSAPRSNGDASSRTPIGFCRSPPAVILLFVRWMYRRDAAELRRPWGWVLTALRTAAFLGLLVLYLQPHWRSEREEVRNSRALLLVDTSLSMGLSDTENDRNPTNSRGLTAPGDKATPDAPSRAQQVAAALKESDFLARLRKTHDVTRVRVRRRPEAQTGR